MSIDAALAAENVSEIPSEQIQNLIDYIQIELLHNEVDNDVRKRLEKLLVELLQSV